MKEEKEQTVIEKTLLYLENYREMERYINEAVSETSQVPDIGKYNISAEKAFLQSVRECRAETVILFEHLKKALASLKEDAEAAGEGYKYDALEAVYIKGIHDRHVTLWDLGENDENFSDDDAEGVTLSVQVTIFSESDEVELAREIKSIMKENDFSFEGRNGDDSKPEDGIYMKAQRFSKFYEMEE